MYINIEDEFFGNGSVLMIQNGVNLEVNVGSKMFGVDEEMFKRSISIDSKPHYDIQDESWVESRGFIKMSGDS